MKTTIIKSFIILISASVLASCSGSSDETGMDKNSVSVRTSEVRMKLYPRIVQFPGQVIAEDISHLSTKVMGNVQTVHVEEGESVARGQVLISIDDEDMRAKLAQVQAQIREATVQLENTSRNYDRIKALYEQKSATQKEMDDISTHLESVKSRLSAAEQMKRELQKVLSYSKVKAPYAGVITRIFIEEGTMANPGQPLATIENDQIFKVVAKVAEREVVRLQTGAKAKVHVDVIGASLMGEVTQVNPSGQFGGGQYEITLRLDAKNMDLVNGLFARVELALGEESSIRIPQESLVRRGQLTGVYTMNMQNEASLRWIRIGTASGDSVEVLSGLRNGDQLIVESEKPLHDGLAVSSTSFLSQK